MPLISGAMGSLPRKTPQRGAPGSEGRASTAGDHPSLLTCPPDPRPCVLQLSCPGCPLPTPPAHGGTGRVREGAQGSTGRSPHGPVSTAHLAGRASSARDPEAHVRDFSPSVMPTRLPASSRVHLVRPQANNIFLETFQPLFRIKSEYKNGPQPDHIRNSDPQLQPADQNTQPSPQEAAQDAAHSLWARPDRCQTSISSDSPRSPTTALGHPPTAQASSVTHSFLSFVLASH